MSEQKLGPLYTATERKQDAQDSKAKQPDNESHKEDFDELLKKAIQVK